MVKIMETSIPTHCDNCGKWSSNIVIIRELFYKSRYIYGEFWCNDCINLYQKNKEE